MATTENHRAIHSVIEARCEGLRNKDMEALSGTATPDNTLFSLAPPLVAVDRLAGLRAWFATWDGPIVFELRDLQLVAGETVAFAHGLAHMAGRRTDGATTDLWFRLTLGLEKRDGTWKITHEHQSTPFEMDGSFRASVHLKP